MKKLMFAATALVAGLAMADVTSANIVGYNNRSLDLTKDNWKLVSLSFNEVGAKTEGVAFDKVLNMTGIAPVLFEEATGEDKGACVLTRDPVTGGYTNYIYINDAGENYDETGWADDGEGMLLKGSVKVDCGFGIWLRLGSDVSEGDINVSGEVISDQSVKVDFNPGWSILANPYPVAINPNNLTTLVDPVLFEDATGAEKGACILTRDPVTGFYTNYIYISDAGENYDETGWSDDSEGMLIESEIIPVGHAFWMRSEKAGSLEFSL